MADLRKKKTKAQSVFTKKLGSTCLSIADKKDDRIPTKGKQEVRSNGTNEISTRDIVDGLEKFGFVDFEHELQPPRPFEGAYGKYDAYDIQDMYAPTDKSIDSPSFEFTALAKEAVRELFPSEKMESVVEDGGVRKRILKASPLNGQEYSVADGCRVWVHYEMYMDKGTCVALLDSTAQHKLATSFEIGQDGLLGMYYAIKSMKKKEISEFIFEPDYGYGKMGVPFFVEGNQRLRVVIQVVEITAKSRKPTAFLTPMEKATADISLPEIFEDAENLIAAGNAKVELELYRDASDRYNWALSLFEDFRNNLSPFTPEEEAVDKKCFQLYSNLALCNLRLDDYEETRKVCKAAMQLIHYDTNLMPKVLFRYTVALIQLKEFDKAKKLCHKGADSCLWGKAEFRDLLFKIKAEEIIYEADSKSKQKEQPGQNEVEEMKMDADSADVGFAEELENFMI